MLITVQREYKASATPGRLFINGAFFCHTLELPRFRCIPEGEYNIRLTESPRFGRIMPLIDKVTGMEGVRIHWGNFVPKDTSGCLLVGYDKGVDAYGVDAIFRSKKCFEEIFTVMQAADRIRIEFKSVSVASVE